MLLADCEDTVVVVPVDIAPLLPGWPEAFVERMTRHGSEVIVSGPGGTGIDKKADLDLLPQNIDAYVWTNQVTELS